MKWITRERVRMDRTAVAGLVQKLVDPEAVFLFAPGPLVLERAYCQDRAPKPT